MKKNFLLLTFIALCPAMQASEQKSPEVQMSYARRNERIAQLRTELARLQAADIEAPDSPNRHTSPISMRGIQVVEPQPAPAAQIMQDNPAVNNGQAENRCCSPGVCILGTGVILTCFGAFTFFIYETIQYCQLPENKHKHHLN